MENYEKAGHYPVHIGYFIDDRFEVLQKLEEDEWGSVWLCRHQDAFKWMAVTILTADESRKYHDEDALYRNMRKQLSPEELETNRIIISPESFWLHSIHGSHLCFVTPVMGYTLSPNWSNFRHTLSACRPLDSLGIK